MSRRLLLLFFIIIGRRARARVCTLLFTLFRHRCVFVVDILLHILLLPNSYLFTCLDYSTDDEKPKRANKMKKKKKKNPNRKTVNQFMNFFFLLLFSFQIDCTSNSNNKRYHKTSMSSTEWR